jgi:hypothetical protein
LLEGSHDSWSQDRGVHIGIVERREVEEIEKRSVNSPAKLGGSVTGGRFAHERGDSENIGTDAELAARAQRYSSGAHRLVSQDCPIGGLIHDANTASGALDAEVNPTHRGRWEDDVARGVTPHGQGERLLDFDLLLGAVGREDGNRKAAGH